MTCCEAIIDWLMISGSLSMALVVVLIGML